MKLNQMMRLEILHGASPREGFSAMSTCRPTLRVGKRGNDKRERHVGSGDDGPRETERKIPNTVVLQSIL